MLILSDVLTSTGYAHRGFLQTAPLSGGAARDLFEDVVDAAWAPDGGSMALVRAPGWRHRLEFPAGKVLYETAGWVSHPRVSPKGDLVAFLDHPQFGDDGGSIAIIDRNGKKTTLSAGWSSAQGLAWSPSGEEIWFTATEGGSNRALHAVTRSGRQRIVTRSPGVLTLQDMTSDGRALINHASERIGMVGLGADGKTQNLSWLDWSRAPCLSEDGGTLAFTEEAEGGGAGYSVYLRKTDGSPAVRLGEGEGLALSPDGKWVLSALVRLDPAPLILLPTGAGEPKPLPKDSINHDAQPAAFLPDGRRIVFIGTSRATAAGPGSRISTAARRARSRRRASSERSCRRMAGSSPRAARIRRWLCTRSRGPGAARRGVRARMTCSCAGPPIGGSCMRAPATGGCSPRGSIASKSRPAGAKIWKEFSLPDPTGVSGISCSAITPDGKAFVFTYGQQFSDLYIVDGLK